MESGVTVSNEAILAAIGLVGAGFSALFLALRQAYSHHLKDKDREIERWFEMAKSSTEVAEKTVTSSRRRA